MIKCIYKILNTVNGKFYIGNSSNFNKRKSQHLENLKLNKHDNSLLQNAWNKYSEWSFRFEVIEYCEKEKLIEREQYWLDKTQSYNREIGYNLRPIANSNLGIKFSEQARKNMSLAHIGKKLTKEHIQKLSIINTGKKRSKEAIINISNSLKGRKFTDKHRLNLSLSHKNKKHKDSKVKNIEYLIW